VIGIGEAICIRHFTVGVLFIFLHVTNLKPLSFQINLQKGMERINTLKFVKIRSCRRELLRSCIYRLIRTNSSTQTPLWVLIQLFVVQGITYISNISVKVRASAHPLLSDKRTVNNLLQKPAKIFVCGYTVKEWWFRSFYYIIYKLR